MSGPTQNKKHEEVIETETVEHTKKTEEAAKTATPPFLGRRARAFLKWIGVAALFVTGVGGAVYVLNGRVTTTRKTS